MLARPGTQSDDLINRVVYIIVGMSEETIARKENARCRIFGDDREFDEYFYTYIKDVTNDIFWIDMKGYGSYQGRVIGLAIYNNSPMLYEGWYGSCGGCGAWGEGGEPTTLEEILSESTIYEDVDVIDLRLRELSNEYDLRSVYDDFVDRLDTVRELIGGKA